ncbi:sensor histidine kinase [Nonomuraea gerenzanensis]|uniref:histidine kinase n=1 Tax=Nonomuraea gerenzanensis TaxID=93944 RepID=A0A1M4EEV4_9ACTN|nr:HAMP domain-containing sensor histidine kinase [Nonomuraea gerenzanensis]UBU09124.1 HAMP domain-containing histidine kinase [Nonomuraea gerenzanensis]SBO97511.1 two-component system sensor kinase [Nonomuraea gerenzanensis]
MNPAPPARARLWWNSRRLRLRLTLLYGGLFFVSGSILLGLTYLITARALDQQFVTGPVKITGGAPLAQAPPPPEAAGDVIFRRDVQSRADGVLSEMVSWSLVVMILVGIIALLLGYVVADRALRPLDRVTETAQRLSESTLHERIGLRGPPDEVKRLADTFDAMLDRLRRVFDAQRRFIANASHELRTPLAVNRTVLEVSLEEPAASADLKALARALLGTNARYERLIEGLLLLAQSEQELTVRKPVDVEQVARTVLEQLDPGSRKRPVTLHQDLRPALVEGDPLFLERCVFNLLENAIKYNVRGGHIWLTVAGQPEGASITVENTGPLVPAYEVEDLFEPFSRMQGERVRSFQGAGLGLSIVRAIVVAHGGSVTALARPEGGLRVEVRLPRTPS